VFVSYKSDDRERVRLLVDSLRERGLDVWWDQDIDPSAPWEETILKALNDAKCMIVCWTKASTHADNGAKVQVEAREAMRAAKLLQVNLEPVEAPLFFRQYQCADLSGWKGNGDNETIEKVAQVARQIASGERLPASPEALAARKRLSRRAAVAIGAMAALFAAFGAYWLNTQNARLYFCTIANPDDICIPVEEIDRYASELKKAKDVLSQYPRAYINDKSIVLPQLAWALSQLAASTTDNLAELKDEYFDRMAGLLDPACGCYLNGDAPHTISNLWAIIASDYFGRPVANRSLAAVLDGQSPQGWWSATLDAAPGQKNASTYVTAFAILALQHELDLGKSSPALEQRLQAAIDQAAAWLSLHATAADSHLADYPNASRNLSHASIDGQAIAALAIAKPDISVAPLTRQLARELDSLPELWATTGSDVLIERVDAPFFHDGYRHVSSGWILLGAVSGFKDLAPRERVQVVKGVRRVFSRDLTDKRLFHQEWVAAESIFALNETVQRLYELKHLPSGRPGGGARQIDRNGGS